MTYRLILVFAAVLGAISCALIRVPYFPFELMLDASIMPAGWLLVRQEQVLLVEFDNAESRTLSFSPSGKMDSLIGVRQQVTLFNDKELAIRAYDQQLAESFPNEYWKTPPAINFTPSNSEDKFDVKCLDVSVNSKPISTCSYFQLHQNRMTIIWANIDGSEITMDQFLALLPIVDERLTQTLESTATPD